MSSSGAPTGRAHARRDSSHSARPWVRQQIPVPPGRPAPLNESVDPLQPPTRLTARVSRAWLPCGVRGAVLLGSAGWHVQRGYGESDRSHEYQEIRRFDALFDMLPARSAVVADDYLVNSMIRYKLLGEHAGGQRDIRGPVLPRANEVGRLYEAGFEVIAFARSALALRVEGFRFGEVTLFESEERQRSFVESETSSTEGPARRSPIDPDRGVEFDQSRKGYGVAHIRSMQLYRVLSPGACEDLDEGGWVDVARFAQEGKVVVSASGGASLTMYVGRDLPLRPRLTYRSDGSTLTLETRPVDEDEYVESIPLNRSARVLRLTLGGARQEAIETTTLVLGGIPDFAVAGRTGPDAGTLRICSATLGYDGLFGDPTRRVEHLDWQRNGHDELLGHGWDGQYPDGLRRAAEAGDELLLPIWRRDALHVSVTAAPPAWMQVDDFGVIRLEANGQMLESHEMSRGWTAYQWTIPADSVRQGMNRVSLHLALAAKGPDDAGRPRGHSRQRYSSGPCRLRVTSVKCIWQAVFSASGRIGSAHELPGGQVCSEIRTQPGIHDLQPKEGGSALTGAKGNVNPM